MIADGSALKLFGSPKELLNLGMLAIDDFAWMRDGALLPERSRGRRFPEWPVSAEGVHASDDAGRAYCADVGDLQSTMDVAEWL